MDDLQFGTRNKRGDWTPTKHLEIAPYFTWPRDPMKWLAWLWGYLFPWNLMYMALTFVFWMWLTPTMETMKTFEFGWIAFLLARNSLLVLVIYGALELRLYLKRAQGNRFKFNAKWPSEHPSEVFMFKSQNIDNIIRTFVSGVPIWTTYEVLGYWAIANGYGPFTTFAENPVWLLAFGFVLPLWHEFHFYCIHRLIHTPVLYKYIHSVHHNSVNPSP